MEVYIVTEPCYCDESCCHGEEIIGIFSTKAKANAYVEANRSSYRYYSCHYESYEVDKHADWCAKETWIVRIRKSDSTILEEWKGKSRFQMWKFDQDVLVENKQKYIWVHSTASLDRAREIAVEELGKL